MTAKPNTTTTATVHSVPNGWYSITDYGASTALADNGPAINSAYNAAKTGGGTVYIPPGTWKFSTQLVFDQNSKSVSIRGAHSAVGGLGLGTTELRYTGSGATTAISCHSVFGFGMEYIYFTYDKDRKSVV